MTTSNHRPFTYPDGRIDVPSGTKREGAVKYTDRAIGDMLAKVRTKSWFKDTLFVILADHQASSAGRLDLPVARYHIPLWIYSPEHVRPLHIDTVASQIDLGPTILAQLNMSYTSKFFGKDILSMRTNEQRALIGTYQYLGLFKDHDLAILSPPRHTRIVRKADTMDAQLTEEPLATSDIAYYEAAAYVFDHRLNAWDHPRIEGNTRRGPL